MEQNILDKLNELIKDKGETLLLTLLENIQPKDFLTEKEMCKYLDVSKSTLHRWKERKSIRVYGLEGRIYYSREEVKKLILSNPLNQFLMLDHIKMLTDNPEIIKRLAEHPDFESKYYVGRTAKYEYLKIHKKYKGKIKLVFNAIFGSDHDIIGYNYVKISIFPHFHYNHYKHNGNDLNKTNCINSLYEILDILGIKESEYIDFKIINLEVGLNLYLETDVRDFIENIKLYKTTPFKENKDYEYYKISDTTNYKNIKIYAKGLQHEKNPEYKIPINTVRFEIRSNQRKYIKKVLKIYSLNDLLDEKKIFNFLRATAKRMG